MTRASPAAVLRRDGRSRVLCAALGLAAAALFGCAPTTDPSHGAALSLRDVLLATPEQVRTLPLEERVALGQRLEELMQEQAARGAVTAQRPHVAAAIVGAFDRERAARGDEAVIVVALEDAADPSVMLRTLAPESLDAGTRTDAGPAATLLIADDSLRDELDRAGWHATRWIDRMARDRGVTELIAVRSMPAGLVGDAERMYVNPVWLELLGLHDAGGVGVTVAELDGPPAPPALGHHTTSSAGWGCYTVTPASCTGGFSGPARCTCETCGFDCGPCATECGPGSAGVHCAVEDRRPPPGSPFDVVWIVAPVAYLSWRSARRWRADTVVSARLRRALRLIWRRKRS